VLGETLDRERRVLHEKKTGKHPQKAAQTIGFETGGKKKFQLGKKKFNRFA